MKSNEKRMIIILVMVAILIIAVIYLATRGKKENNEKEIEEKNQNIENFVEILEDGTKLNISSKLHEEKELDGLKIGNIQITEKNGQFLLLADVTNTTNKDIEPFYINIILYNKNGEQISTVIGAISPTKAGKKSRLSAAITEDYANAYDFKVTRK